VIDWLYYLKKAFFVVNENDTCQVVKLTIDGNFVIKIKDTLLSSKDIDSVWYRRGALRVPEINIDAETESLQMTQYFKHFYYKENTRIIDFINRKLSRIKNINNQLYANVDKLMVLETAAQIGLSIPESLITSEKKILCSFIQIHGSVITKPATECFCFHDDKCSFNTYTEIITEDFLASLPETFPTSFFQCNIHKRFEIRTFYLHGICYSMAIFSQNNPKTMIDFRHYDEVKPNRRVPFKLPTSIEKKVNQLMQTLKLTSGSLDFIYGTDKMFYFLEVNPIGQFGMTSYPCNYSLEKIIAEYL
jgi:ATP-GRASP peptide maturase of grasp-with-spasm system